MAEAILFGLAQKMIENLGSQTFQEIGSLWGVKGELEKIKNTVSTIQAVLLDAAEKQSHDHQVKDWLQKLNDAVYEADDLLSEFSTEAMRRRAASGNKVRKELHGDNYLKNLNKFLGQYGHGIITWIVSRFGKLMQLRMNWKHRMKGGVCIWAYSEPYEKVQQVNRRSTLRKAVINFKPLTSSKKLHSLVV